MFVYTLDIIWDLVDLLKINELLKSVKSGVWGHHPYDWKYLIICPNLLAPGGRSPKVKFKYVLVGNLDAI